MRGSVFLALAAALFACAGARAGTPVQCDMGDGAVTYTCPENTVCEIETGGCLRTERSPADIACPDGKTVCSAPRECRLDFDTSDNVPNYVCTTPHPSLCHGPDQPMQWCETGTTCNRDSGKCEPAAGLALCPDGRTACATEASCAVDDKGYPGCLPADIQVCESPAGRYTCPVGATCDPSSLGCLRAQQSTGNLACPDNATVCPSPRDCRIRPDMLENGILVPNDGAPTYQCTTADAQYCRAADGTSAWCQKGTFCNLLAGRCEANVGHALCPDGVTACAAGTACVVENDLWSCGTGLDLPPTPGTIMRIKGYWSAECGSVSAPIDKSGTFVFDVVEAGQWDSVVGLAGGEFGTAALKGNAGEEVVAGGNVTFRSAMTPTHSLVFNGTTGLTGGEGMLVGYINHDNCQGTWTGTVQ